MTRPVIFLDRDGVLNVNRSDYVKSWDEFVFLPGTFHALRQFTRLGYPLVVVTNQAGVGRRIITHEIVDDIHHRMRSELRRHGVRIEGIYYCPHQVSDECGCRKPEPGLLFQAADQLGIDLANSVLIGDAHTDIAAGRRAGCRTILVLTGKGEWSLRHIQKGGVAAEMPDTVLADLPAAVATVKQFLRSTASLQRLGASGRVATLPETIRLSVPAIEHGIVDTAGHFIDD